MKMNKYKKQIKNIRNYLNNKYNLNTFKEETLARSVKLIEEVGELCAEVLVSNSLKPKKKKDNNYLKNLDSEFADVIITTLLLAESMNVDVELAIDKKIKKINKKFNL